MKYYVCKCTERSEIKNAREYVYKTDRRKGIAMFEFDDGNYRDFFEKAGITESMVKEGFGVLGQDNVIYKISATGIEKSAIKRKMGKTLIWHFSKLRSLRFRRRKAFNQRMLAKSGGTITRHGRSITKFKKYVYINRQDGVVIPFRLKTANAPNRPLVIYHGGAGTIGCDNFKTLFEFFADASGKKVTAANCNILIPQWTSIEGDSEDERQGVFANNCAELIKTIADNSDIDKNRIYVYGISHGAMITWKSLWCSPTLYTASVQAMGLVYDYAEADFDVIKDIPMWIAHSSDDKGVPIDSDDFCFERLKALGADVEYSRWDKYGHKMASRFYKQEPWLEWLLSKTKQKSKD